MWTNGDVYDGAWRSGQQVCLLENTCTHTYIHWYIQTYIHTCIYTYVRTNIRTCIRTATCATVRGAVCSRSVGEKKHVLIHTYVHILWISMTNSYMYAMWQIHMCDISFICTYVLPIPLGVTFSNAVSKHKAQRSNVSFHWKVAKETFELWALSFRKCHPNWDWLYVYTYRYRSLFVIYILRSLLVTYIGLICRV